MVDRPRDGIEASRCAGAGWFDFQVNGFAGVDFQQPDLLPEPGFCGAHDAALMGPPRVAEYLGFGVAGGGPAPEQRTAA